MFKYPKARLLENRDNIEYTIGTKIISIWRKIFKIEYVGT